MLQSRSVLCLTSGLLLLTKCSDDRVHWAAQVCLAAPANTLGNDGAKALRSSRQISVQLDVRTSCVPKQLQGQAVMGPVVVYRHRQT